MEALSSLNGLSVWQCGHCARLSVRMPSGGQRPRWCSSLCRSAGHRDVGRSCLTCGKTGVRRDASYCCRECVPPRPQASPMPRQLRLPLDVDRRSSLRKAYEARDFDLLMEALVHRTRFQGQLGCWEWTGPVKGGYAHVYLRGSRRPVHRVMAEVRWPHLLDLPIHHLCANRLCVNPAHHVPAAAADNVLEMLQRRWFVDRIAHLEQALAALDPLHPLLPPPGGDPSNGV